MLKKNLILCLLLFFYTVVLAHNAIPHGHFDEVLNETHDSDSHEHDDHSSHDHHYLFSHSISLHVTIEKQIAISAIQSKIASKSFPTTATLCLFPGKQCFTPPDSFWTLVQFTAKLPGQDFRSNYLNRGPPMSGIYIIG